jgi:hypothetical protein
MKKCGGRLRHCAISIRNYTPQFANRIQSAISQHSTENIWPQKPPASGAAAKQFL